MTLRVELVEDDVILARLFKEVLEKEGMLVHHSRSAGEAMAAIDDQLPDVCILDMLLPVQSGLALLHELQSYSDTANLPIIVCSSLASTLTLAELAPYGVRRVLDKTTMHPRDLVSAVRAVLT